VDDFNIRFVAIREHDKEQDQPSSHPNDLITLLSLALDEVVAPHHMMRIVEDFRRCFERDPVSPLIPCGLGTVPRESYSHITVLYIHLLGASVIGMDYRRSYG
jgi:hypothetical protein